MTLRGEDDDTSAGRITQGGSPDHDSPGPGRQRGNSIWWFALVLLVVVALAVALMTGGPHKDAPAERGFVPVSGESGPSRIAPPRAATR